MASISSPGLGSGIDIQGIVSKLVALERAPLAPLQNQATSLQSKLSVFGIIQSQVSALGDAAAKLAGAGGWNGVTARSSNPQAVGVSASAGAARTALTVEVQQLARAQSTASAAVPAGTGMGSGTLSIQLGDWSGGAFSAGASAAVDVAIDAADTLADIAAKINGAGAGVSATVLRDASGERLLVRSDKTGQAEGFRITVADDDGTPHDAAGLSRLAYDPGTAGGGMALSQAGANALATINNVAIESASNQLDDSLPNMKLTLSQVTTGPVEIQVDTDLDSIRQNIKAFVDTYNTLNNTLANATRYDAASKVAGPLQGDNTTVGLQNALRSMMRSVTASSPFTRLSDLGIEAKTGGALEINASKLDAALAADPKGVQGLFTQASSDTTQQGFGLKIKAFTTGLLSVGGLVSSKTDALQGAITRNGKEQEKVNDRAARAEVRLLAQYNAMDAQVGQLASLNAFVAQQITLWNKSSDR